MTKLKTLMTVSLLVFSGMISQSALASQIELSDDQPQSRSAIGYSDFEENEQEPINFQLNLGGFDNLEDLCAFAESCSKNQRTKMETEINQGLTNIPTLQYFYSNKPSISGHHYQSQFALDDSRIRFEVPGRVNDENDPFEIERRQTAKNRSRNGFITGVGIDFAAYPDPFGTTGRHSTYR